MIPISEFLKVSRGNVACPFHVDSTPSSRVYEDKDGIARLFCYSCGFQYMGFDYIKKILGEDPTAYFLARFPKTVLEAALAGIPDQVFIHPKIDISRQVATYHKDEDIEKFLHDVYIKEE